MKLDTRFPTRFPTTITTSLDEDEVSNEDEIHCNNGLEIGTQDPHFISLIEYSAAHNAEHFVKLRQQERQSSKSPTSPVENGWSPAEREWSPAEREWSPAEHEFTSAEIKFSPAETTESPKETTSTRVPHPGVQPRVQTTVTRVPNPGVSRRIETTVSRVPNPGVSPRVETTVSRLPNPGVSPRVETILSRVPKPGVQPSVEKNVSRSSNAVASTRVKEAVSHAPNPGVSATPNPLPTRITQHRSSSYSSAATLPFTSYTTHPNTLSRRTSGAAASSFSLSSGPDISQPSTSGGNRSLDRRESRTELDPGAQRASDIVRQRYPPVKGPPVIPISSVVGIWNLYGGSRKRKAHADTGDVNSLRQRASGGGVSSPPKRSAKGATKKKMRQETKKYQENFRGRKNWK